MAVIYLKHPVHGAKVASTDMEANEDRKNGWEDFDPTVPAVPAFLQVESDLAADFPGRQALIDGGLPMWKDLVGKSAEDLQAVKGIGPATAKQILDLLNS